MRISRENEEKWKAWRKVGRIKWRKERLYKMKTPRIKINKEG